MHVKFSKDWDWRERPSAIVAYLKDQTYSVPKRAGEAAIAAGVAEELVAPKKGEAAIEVANSAAVRARADGQNKMPTEADLGEAEGAAGAAGATGNPGSGTPAGGTPSAT